MSHVLVDDKQDYVPVMATTEYIINRKALEKLNENYSIELANQVNSEVRKLNKMPEKEQVLVFPRSTFEALGAFTGVSKEGTPCPVNAHPFLANPAFRQSLRYMDRETAETDENFLQLIPYCVFKCGKNFLIYQRTKKGGEARLHDKWSLGVGGHLNPCDGEPTASYESGMLRELKEEVDFDLNQGDIKNEVIGLLYDSSNAVGRVHFGVIHLIEVNNDAVLNFKDEALDKGSWVGYDWLLENVEKFENWSQLTIEHLG